MKKYLELIRTNHWIKNLLIFIPMICAKVINYNNIITTFIGFLSFSLTSSFIYIINDIKDLESDKLSERKKLRPLANGKISKKVALIIAIIIIIISLLLNCYLNKGIFNAPTYVLLSYIIINIAYSLGLKNIPIIDICLLASGFIIRIYYGASLLNIEVSNWLFLTILNASLFIGLGKRKKEFLINKDIRKVLAKYNENFLDKFEYLTLTLLIVFYSLWTMEQNNKYLIYTVPFLIIIFMKYCLILENESEGDPITIIYKDKSLLILCTIYSILMFIILTI